MWDAKSEKLVSWYFTTAGFYTQASVEIDDGKIGAILTIRVLCQRESELISSHLIVEFATILVGIDSCHHGSHVR